MLRRILFCLLTLALLAASPGLHWHDHAHEAVAAANATADNEDDDSNEAAENLCVDCVLQAQHAAVPSDGMGPLGAVRHADGHLRHQYAEALPRAPPGGAIRVRGPPLTGS